LTKNILLDARIGNGENPGIQSFVEGFAIGLNELQLKKARIFWLTTSDNGWLTKLIGLNQEVLIDEPQHLYEMSVDATPLVGDSRYEHDYSTLPIDKRLPREPRVLDQVKPDLVQFFSQDAFVTTYPTIYHPHDLQHVYLTDNFSVEEIGWRNLSWPKYAGLASKVVVGSQHVVNDIKKYWGIPIQNIEKIELCSTLDLVKTTSEPFPDLVPINTFGRNYVIYPASYYLHKNHVKLLQGISLLKSQGLIVNVVLTGGVLNGENHIKRAIRELGLEDQVFELGYVPKGYLVQLILNSKCVVVPSLFESRSFPVAEGMRLGVPVIASNIPGIREQHINSNFLFNPDSELEIANSVKGILTLDDEGRDTIIRKNLSVSNRRNWADVILDYTKLWDQVFEGEKS
jgi:glycosyltransferase involved in cell wall biosynthesis